MDSCRYNTRGGWNQPPAQHPGKCRIALAHLYTTLLCDIEPGISGALQWCCSPKAGAAAMVTSVFPAIYGAEG